MFSRPAPAARATVMFVEDSNIRVTPPQFFVSRSVQLYGGESISVFIRNYHKGEDARGGHVFADVSRY